MPWCGVRQEESERTWKGGNKRTQENRKEKRDWVFKAIITCSIQGSELESWLLNDSGHTVYPTYKRPERTWLDLSQLPSPACNEGIQERRRERRDGGKHGIHCGCVILRRLWSPVTSPTMVRAGLWKSSKPQLKLEKLKWPCHLHISIH